MTANKQIGWSQEASLLSVISRQLEQLAGGIFAMSGGGSTPGSLKTTGDVAITATPTRITDGAGNNSGLYLSTNSISAYAGTPPANGNTAIGLGALGAATTTTYCVAIGQSALAAETVNPYNTAIGVSAMSAHNDFDGSATRGQNTAVGAFAFYAGTSGKWNTVIGTSALQNGAGSFNTIVGAHAGENNGGSWNIFIGTYAGSSTSGSNNISINTHGGGGGITTGNNNIVIDPRAHSGITTGSGNTVIGGYLTNIPGASTDCVFIGTGSGTTRMSFDSAGQMTITTIPTQGSGVSTEKVIVRESANGLLKQVEYIATNSTTSALSAATLNATYPAATTGFRVVCMSISGGALIYTKTGSTSWCSNAVTATA